MGLRVEPASKTGEFARRSDDPMAGRNDRHRISAVRGAYSADRGRIPDLPCDLSVGSGLAERDRQQGLPHLALKGRSGKIQLQ